MRRASLLIVGAFGLFVFLGISFLLARAFSATGQERAAVLEVLRAQARGDAAAVLERLPACAGEPACVRVTRARVRRLEAPGRVEVLNYVPSVQLAITTQRGTGRVAWRVGTGRPIVQCVRVRREGPLSGGGVELLSISDPIAPDRSCGSPA